MPPHRRPPISTAVRDVLLFKNDHTCCICNERLRDVQVHHIDGNPANNALKNLAVLCLNCHSRATGTRGLGQAHRPGEIRVYKRSWERKIAAMRRVYRQPKIDAQALAAQVDLIVCEILAAGRDADRASRLLDVLYNLNLWRGDRMLSRRIVDGLFHLAIHSGLESHSVISPLVAEKLWEVCWHFVGPDEVPMDKQDERQVLRCAEALGTLATFTCMSGQGRRAIRVATEQAENLFQVGLWYRRERIIKTVLDLYPKASEECGTRWVYGRQTLSRSLRRLMRLSQQENIPRRIRELIRRQGQARRHRHF